MKKLFTFAVFLALSYLLGNSAMAQNQTIYSMVTEVKETIDFTGWSSQNNGTANADVTWNSNTISSISGNNGSNLNRSYTSLEHQFFFGNGSQSSEPTTSTIYSGWIVFDSWSSTLVINRGQFNNANVGDIIRVNYTNKGSDYNPWFKYVGSWGDLNALQNVKEEGEGYFQAVINQEALNEIKANGLRFQGVGFTLTSVQLISQPSYPKNTWRLWRSDTHSETYLQKYSQNADYFNITNLQNGDVVTIWGDNGQNGGCRVTQGTTDRNGQDITFSTENHNEGQQIKMGSNGTLQLQFFGQWSGIRKIEIKREIEQRTIFDYDPGYEEYDMYDEFSWEKNNNPATTYSNSGSAGFNLNGVPANYVTFSGSKITTNNRFALTGAANEWTFDFGLVPPGQNGDYSFLSICNLREGDRVVISYINDSENPLVFASGINSQTNEFYYEGCAAFKDDNRNGVLNDGEEYVNDGYVAPADWHRGEGNVGANDQGYGTSYTPELYYINSYVITQDGHLDLAFRRFVENNEQHQADGKKVSRIVKVKIFSDHQAMMVDDYNNGTYKAYYNITGELQAKEHIMPGGLEIHVGNNDASQHSLVVSSKDGPVSYVNAVDGFKLPGVSKSNDQININFDLGVNGNINNLPTTGTFYRFIPEASGKMKFKFEAKSMNYYRWDLMGYGTYHNTDAGGDWPDLNDRPNEQTVDAGCPYYLVTISEENGQKVMSVQQLNDGQNIDNGGSWETPDFIDVEEGKEYYLYGGWNQSGLYYKSSWGGTTPIPDTDENNAHNNIEFRPFDGKTIGCGVAQLLWVEFKRNDEIYPLAKWVPNDTRAVNETNSVPNPDTYEAEYELANIVGFANYDDHITVKKMSGNVESCEPYIWRNPDDRNIGKLMIRNIVYKDGENPGGTILIKLGDPNKRTDPLYSLTIAYSTDPQYDKTGSNNETIRGHVWDFHTSSLKGLTWDGSENGAQPTPMGTYFDNYYGQSIENYYSAAEVQNGLPKDENSFLYDEVENHGDWMFYYYLLHDGKMYEPVFTNKYDMEGDNADMIWDTEGTVFQTSANQCGIFNEYGNVINHGSTASTDIDPNRYVAILKGGTFRIPWLRPNDRVIIWMGSGKGRTDDFVTLKIKNAYDALHNPIDKNDEYIVGGTQWYKDDSNYHGCYHFFAKGDENSPAAGHAADMVFEMTGGEMCKIYKVQIYRGDRIITNEVVGAGENDKFLLVTTEKDPNDETEEVGTKGAASNWTLQYFGKDQKLADGSNSVNNDIIAQTGHITKSLTTDTNEESDTYNTFTYPHDFGEIGTFRVRGKDMEKNMKYVADYADHNVTVAYQETQKYPYTWDFKDMKLYNESLFEAEDNIAPTKPVWFDSDERWNASYEKSSQDLSLWVASTQREGAHVLRLNSQRDQDTDNLKEKDNIFQSDYYNYNGNQLWANGEVVPESKGLWFFTPDNNQNNGQWYISDAGMELDGNSDWSHKMVVPNVPKNGAVYLRMLTTKTPYFSEQFMKDNDNCVIYGPIVVRNKTNEYIFAILNTGEKQNLLLSLAGYRLLKLAVSNDFKSLDSHGWASESREHVIDPALTAYMTDKDIETCFVTVIQYNETNPTKGGSLKLVRANIDDNDKGDIVRASADGDFGGCLIHNTAGVPVSILPKDKNKNNYGFHLFVPDLHDYNNNNSGDYTSNDVEGVKKVVGENLLKAQVGAGWIKPVDGDYTNYILSNQYYVNDQGNLTGDVEAFYRVSPTKNNGLGAKSNGNNAYLQLETSKITKQSSANGFTFTFGEGDDADGINEVSGTIENTSNSIYTIDGNKLETMPTRRGLYIINGKKVVIR